MVGQSSIDAIGKGDRAEGQLLLSAFNESSNVLSAASLCRRRSRFAEYSRADEQAPAPGATQFEEKLARTYWSKGNRHLVASRLRFMAKQIGTVYLHAQLRGSWKQTIRFAIITGVILAAVHVSGVAGWGLSSKAFWPSRLSRLPTQLLKCRVRAIIRSDFLPPQEYDELLSLTEAFQRDAVEIQAARSGTGAGQGGFRSAR